MPPLSTSEILRGEGKNTGREKNITGYEKRYDRTKIKPPLGIKWSGGMKCEWMVIKTKLCVKTQLEQYKLASFCIKGQYYDGWLSGVWNTKKKYQMLVKTL